MNTNHFNGYCQKCRKRWNCKAPCAFVDEILKDGNKTPFFERNVKGLNDQPIRQIKSKNWRYEINETNLDQYGKAHGNKNDDRSTPFTTEAEKPLC